MQEKTSLGVKPVGIPNRLIIKQQEVIEISWDIQG